MQCAYINYLTKKNNISSARLEEATGLSAATISRVKTGQRELNQDEFRRVITACGGDDSSYHAFVAALEGSPSVKVDDSVSIASVRKFYQEQLQDVEHRLLSEIERLRETHAKEQEKAQQLHNEAMDRMKKHQEERIAELKEDLAYAREKKTESDKKVEALQDKLEKISNSRGRWRIAFCALCAAFATQWLLDWLVFKDIGFIVSAFRDFNVSLHSLRG